MATAEMSLPDKKPEHESGYYEGSDQEGSMECQCPSPVSSRNSSRSTKLKRRQSHTNKKIPCKKARIEPPLNGHGSIRVDKSVEIVDCSGAKDLRTNVQDLRQHKPSQEVAVPGPSTKRSSSVELIGGTVPAPARDSVDWNLVEASKIRKRCKGQLCNLISLFISFKCHTCLVLGNFMHI